MYVHKKILYKIEVNLIINKFNPTNHNKLTNNNLKLLKIITQIKIIVAHKLLLLFVKIMDNKNYN